jgi:DNA-binding HxlR family transcriptional regulator
VSPETEPSAYNATGVREDAPRECAIADALEIVGDRYSLLVLREIAYGVTRFNEIRHNVGAPRETLATRLRKLEDGGVIARRRYSEHPPRWEYLLTDAGEALVPALQALRRWGERYAAPSVS